MTSRCKQIVLKLLLLHEEYSQKEINDAISFLEKSGSKSVAFDYLLGITKPDKELASLHKANKSDGIKLSAVVSKLETIDIDKYHVLSDFEKLVRKNEILPRLSDIKDLISSITKEISPAKTRKDSIPHLMSALADIPINQIKDIFSQTIVRINEGQGSSEYQRLAHYIITGTYDSR